MNSPESASSIGQQPAGVPAKVCTLSNGAREFAIPVADAPPGRAGRLPRYRKVMHQVTLSDGQIYVLPQNLKVDSLKVGDRVTITAVKQDGANIVKALARG